MTTVQAAGRRRALSEAVRQHIREDLLHAVRVRQNGVWDVVLQHLKKEKKRLKERKQFIESRARGAGGAAAPARGSAGRTSMRTITRSLPAAGPPVDVSRSGALMLAANNGVPARMAESCSSSDEAPMST